MPSRKPDVPPAEPARELQLAENRKARFDYINKLTGVSPHG